MSSCQLERWLSNRPVGQRIFDLLCAYPYGLTRKQLVAMVWNGSKEPDNADPNGMHVHIVKLRWGLRRYLPWLDIQHSSYHPRHGVCGRRYLLVLRRPPVIDEPPIGHHLKSPAACAWRPQGL